MVVSEVRRLREEGPSGGDPQDYSGDERFQSMIDTAFDLAQEYGVPVAQIAESLKAAVAEGDQR